MKTDRRTPAEGEVWASPCQFCWRLDEDGITKGTTLKVGIYRNGDGDPVWDLEGYEVRTVVAVITLPGYQRRVIYTRKFSPDGHKPFGKRGLILTSLSAFNSWRRGTLRRHMKPATLVQESHVETAVKALEAA